MTLTRKLVLAFVLLGLVQVVGVVGYVLIEGWSPLESWWMVVITLTTIGFGEVQPLSPLGRVFTIGLILSGLGLVTFTFTAATRAIFEGDVVRDWRRRKRRKALDALSDHYIVVGYGRLGRAVAAELRATGHAVCVVERGRAAHEAILDEPSRPEAALQGDGADDEVLLLAGIQRARGLAVTTPAGAEAVFITLSARQLNASLPILTRVDNDGQAVKARKAGATGVVSPHSMGGWRMAHGLVRPHTSSFLDIATLAQHDDILLDEIDIDEGTWAGRSLGDLEVRRRYGVLVAAVRRKDGDLVPTPDADTVVRAGDVIIVIGAPERVRKLDRELGG
ncbi:MAG TPA: potassium channel protein [Myxococcota bacterium]|nr:potassium channel protein [Myxococcota bacterium]